MTLETPSVPLVSHTATYQRSHPSVSTPARFRGRPLVRKTNRELRLRCGGIFVKFLIRIVSRVADTSTLPSFA
jgi:hypothetical protein